MNFYVNVNDHMWLVAAVGRRSSALLSSVKTGTVSSYTAAYPVPGQIGAQGELGVENSLLGPREAPWKESAIRRPDHKVAPRHLRLGA